MVYKTTTYKQVITKVQRDFNLTGSNWIPAAIEWMGECLSEIGQHAHLERVSCYVTAKNHRIPLPCNHESTLALQVGNHNLRKGQTLRYGVFADTAFIDSFNKEAYPLMDLDTNETIYQQVIPILDISNQYYLDNPDYIITSFECGTVILHYQAYKLDEDGFPVIPDSSEFREALSFYILYKYLSRGNKHTTWDVQSAYAMWIKYKGKAQNVAKFPDIQSMESFNNMWNRIVRDNFQGDNFFQGSEDKQFNFNI